MFEGRDNTAAWTSFRISHTHNDPLMNFHGRLLRAIQDSAVLEPELMKLCHVEPVAVKEIEGTFSNGIRETVPSAIMIPFIVCNKEPYILITKRAASLRIAPGAHVFPGGRIEEEETPIEAAVRETYEEVGLKVSLSSVLGVLPSFVRHLESRYLITPVVALQEVDTLNFKHNKDEVEEVLLLPVSDWLSRATVMGPMFPITTRNAASVLGNSRVLPKDGNCDLVSANSNVLAPANAFALEMLRRKILLG